MFIWYVETYFRKSEKRGVIARELVESWWEQGGGMFGASLVVGVGCLRCHAVYGVTWSWNRKIAR